jgi:Protein of unknown function (DUF551)
MGDEPRSELCAPWIPLYEAPRWVPVSERMPEPGAAVFVARGKAVMRAVHVPHMAFCEATHGYFEPDGAAYYDAATDETYWPEGWYEWNEHEDTHWRVDREPTHWMPMPEPPPLVSTGPNDSMSGRGTN